MPSLHPDARDTVVAIITPLGEGGIAVLRLSGERAISAADEVFHGKHPLSQAQSHTAHVGSLLDEHGELLDEVVATVFRAPHSYTAENVVEVSCHGSVFIAQRILERFVHLGIRPAEPGEFTKRAFLNGRMDLSQAEAVAELIHSRSDSARRASLHQLQGLHSNKFQEIRDSILHLCSLLELELDFSEEGISLIETSTSESTLTGILAEITQLIDSFRFGKIYRDGIKVVLAGKPNVGKSSLLNALLNENRSIVTEVSGTTRDTIEESVRLGGLSVRIVDTAGLRRSTDPVEVEGIKRTEAEIEDADIVAYVIDISSSDFNEDMERMRQISAARPGAKGPIVVFNKEDLPRSSEFDMLAKNLAALPNAHVSAKTGLGVQNLRDLIADACISGDFPLNEKSVIITNARHQASLIEVRECLQRALVSLREQQSNEFIAVDLRSSLRHIGEITGETTTEDILNNIFASFCIGK